jgi:thiamine-phosphate pyrophosphorylase
MASAPIRGLYAITDDGLIPAGALVQYVTRALQGGASVLQYRNKTADRDRRLQEAQSLAEICRTFQVPFIVNDDVELALAVSAGGVHLGRDDIDLAATRRRLGKEFILGASCYNSLQRALAAQAAGADYVAFGSFFPSPTKPHAVRAGLELLKQARAQIHIPIVAIGGITPENAGALLEAGADALVVIHGIFGQPDPRSAAARYAELFRSRGERRRSHSTSAES